MKRTDEAILQDPRTGAGFSGGTVLVEDEDDNLEEYNNWDIDYEDEDGEDEIDIWALKEEMESNEDEVECIECEESFPKAECEHIEGKGYICPNCKGKQDGQPLREESEEDIEDDEEVEEEDSMEKVIEDLNNLKANLDDILARIDALNGESEEIEEEDSEE